jgi:hypothetical protein
MIHAASADKPFVYATVHARRGSAALRRRMHFRGSDANAEGGSIHGDFQAPKMTIEIICRFFVVGLGVSSGIERRRCRSLCAAWAWIDASDERLTTVHAVAIFRQNLI